MKLALVIDANIVFAAFIKESLTRKSILKKPVELYAPDFVLKEIEKYVPYLLKKTKTSPRKFKNIKELLFQKIQVIPRNQLEPFLEEAEKISPDPNDKHYFALALKLNASIWSNDKALKKQKRVQVYNTQEVLSLLEE